MDGPQAMRQASSLTNTHHSPFEPEVAAFNMLDHQQISIRSVLYLLWSKWYTSLPHRMLICPMLNIGIPHNSGL